MSKTRCLYWYLLSLFVIAFDQVSKHYAALNFSEYHNVRVFSFLNFRLAHNSGAAFSFLAASGGWQLYAFSALAVVVSIFLAVWIYRLPNSAKTTACGVALVLGGAIGNLIDRIRFGYVVDFVDFHLHGWHFATFNIADAAITVGVILLLFASLFKPA
jgi:signal peptidase II